MRNRTRAPLLAAILLLAGVAAAPRAIRAQAANGDVQVIEVTEKKYEYNPAVIHVKKGAKVELRIHALDRTHGFKISLYPDGASKKGEPGLAFTNYQDGWKVEKDQVTTIDFTATQAGTYSFKCSVFCGFGHGGMKGQLVVEP